jgi:hypothetical protein
MLVRSFLILLVLTTGTLLAQPGHGHDDDDFDEGPEPVCGTPMIMNILSHGGPSNAKEKEFMSALQCADRSEKQANILSSKGHFRIHFDRTGRDSVSSVDANSNGVPDYIDSVNFYMELAWDVEINQYGFDAPPDDHRSQGPEVDVYICALDPGLYGYANPEIDNPTDRPNTVMGLLVLDNDYDPKVFKRTPGILGLRVTSAHEFHHIIQFARYRNDYSQASIYEATAVWFERQVHPSIPDYRQYVDNFLQTPQSFGFATQNVSDKITGYAHVIYLDYLAKRLGDRDIVRRMWEEFRTHPLFPDAADAALIPRGLNFENSWCEFAQWCYFTGARARDTTYFREAPVYPTLLPVSRTPRAVGTTEETVIQGSLYPTSFGIYKVRALRPDGVTSDTLDFLITNNRTSYGTGVNVRMEDFILHVSPKPRGNYTPLTYKDNTIYYRLELPPDARFCITPFLSGENVNVRATSIVPQPFINDGAEQLLFGVKGDREEVYNVELSIYSIAMNPVIKIRQTGLRELNNQLGVIWNGRDSHNDLAPSGVYIYQLVINDNPPTLGKFAVVRK